MAVTDSTATRIDDLPAGRWLVDPDASELTFRSRGMFGLAPVKGTFRAYEGELDVDENGARGELRIQAESLDTSNKRRDRHLRSADFFHVREHPVVKFSLAELVPSADGKLDLTGTLQIRDTQLRIDAPVHAVQPAPDQLRLATNVSVDRAAAGVGWSKMGMIQGKAHLSAVIVLVRR